MVFQNVQLDYSNFSFGPTAGRVYSIDHVNDYMVVKTYPGGSLVTTYPLNVNLKNEVIELQFDGYYWYSMCRLGDGGLLGLVLNKWELQGTTLVKQTDIGEEIVLTNTAGIIYDSEAFCVQTFKTYTQFFIASGSTQATFGSTEFLSIGDSIYFGPSTASAGERRERTVVGIAGNLVSFSPAIDVAFNTSDQVIYRKNIWLFNNRNHTSIEGGNLIQINSYTGWVESIYSSTEWKHVTAATSYNGNLAFIREAQLLLYKPFGSNAGYQTSYHLSNISADKTTVLGAVDLEMDDTTVYKLQKKRRILNVGTLNFEDEDSPTDRYEIDTETIASKVSSLSSIRETKSVLFGQSATGRIRVRVLDQYNNPIIGRSILVTEDDSSGSIISGSSFVTDVNGEGVSVYSTGTTPLFRIPTIISKDIGTSYNIKTSMSQLPNEDNPFFVEQIKGDPTETFVEQTRLSTDKPLNQYKPGAGEVFITQQAVQNVSVIEQQITVASGFLDQYGLPSEVTFIEQEGKIEEILNITQYQFLFFASPEPYSQKNPTDTDITVRIIGFGAIPLNVSTLIFKINGIDVTSQVIVTPFGGGLQLYYNPPANFPYSSTVTVSISIQDTDTIPRTVSTIYPFYIVSDYKKPILYLTYPPDNSVNNLQNTFIYAIIKDLETGINLDSIEMYVEGKKVNHITSLIDSETIKVYYQTEVNFPYESDIAVSIFVKDLEDNYLVGSWSFFIKQSTGVLFTNMNPEPCSVLVPVDETVCVEVFGLEDGVNLKTTTFNINGQNIIYVIKPKVLKVN